MREFIENYRLEREGCGFRSRRLGDQPVCCAL